MEKRKNVLIIILSILVLVLSGCIIYIQAIAKNDNPTNKTQNKEVNYTLKYENMEDPGAAYTIVFDSNYDISIESVHFCGIPGCEDTKENKKYSYSDKHKEYIKESLNHIFDVGTKEKTLNYNFEGLYYNDILLIKSIINGDESLMDNRVDNDFKIDDSREDKSESVCNKNTICDDSNNCKQQLLKDNASKIQIVFKDGKKLSLEETLNQKLLTIDQINVVDRICY